MSIFVSIDTETTGLDANCQLIEIGAVIDNWITPLSSPPEFHCYVKQDVYRGEPYALSMHAEIFRRIAIEERGYAYLYPGEVAKALGYWMRANGAYIVDPTHPEGEPRAVVAGKNFQFDDKFLRQLSHFDEHIKYNHRFLDPAMLYWDPLVDVKPPATQLCMERAGLEGEVAHTALEDAKVVAKLIQIAVGRRCPPRGLLKVMQGDPIRDPRDPRVRVVAWDNLDDKVADSLASEETRRHGRE